MKLKVKRGKEVVGIDYRYKAGDVFNAPAQDAELFLKAGVVDKIKIKKVSEREAG